MPYSPTFSPTGTAVSGDLVTVSTYLRQPTRVQRLVEALTPASRFIADRFFGQGPPVPSGAVIYDQVTSADLYTTKDVEVITEGSAIPVLDDSAPNPKLAGSTAYGGAFKVTDQNRNRNQIDVFNRGVRKLSNTIVRKVDGVAVAALDAAPIGSFAGSDWTGATGATMIANLIDAGEVINALEMGYIVDSVALHPTQFNELLKNVDFRTAMTQGTGEDNLLREGMIGTFMGWSFGKSYRITAGTGYIGSSNMAGAISDETPLTTEVVPWRLHRSTYITGYREVAIYVTDPKSVVKLTGI